MGGVPHRNCPRDSRRGPGVNDSGRILFARYLRVLRSNHSSHCQLLSGEGIVAPAETPRSWFL